MESAVFVLLCLAYFTNVLKSSCMSLQVSEFLSFLRLSNNSIVWMDHTMLSIHMLMARG